MIPSSYTFPLFSGQYPTSHMDMLSVMDIIVGVLIEELEERELLENAIVVLTSDNGGMNVLNTGSNVYGHNSSGKLRCHKGSAYEGEHRVPFITRFDHIISVGKTEDNLIGQNDFFSTLCDILDIEIRQDKPLILGTLLIFLLKVERKYKRQFGKWMTRVEILGTKQL